VPPVYHCACGAVVSGEGLRCKPCFYAARKSYPRKWASDLIRDYRTGQHRPKKVGWQRTHGRSHTAAYQLYRGMIERCRNPKAPNYHNYGGRGIRVCARWEKFEHFLADMGERPPGHTLDRIDNDGDYSKENCRWATNRVQHNNKRTNHPLTFNGRTQTIADWARELGISYYTLNSRVTIRGWSADKALSTPINPAYRRVP